MIAAFAPILTSGDFTDAVVDSCPTRMCNFNRKRANLLDKEYFVCRCQLTMCDNHDFFTERRSVVGIKSSFFVFVFDQKNLPTFQTCKLPPGASHTPVPEPCPTEIGGVGGPCFYLPLAQ